MIHWLSLVWVYFFGGISKCTVFAQGIPNLNISQIFIERNLNQILILKYIKNLISIILCREIKDELVE
jgi:hypothetical protein